MIAKTGSYDSGEADAAKNGLIIKCTIATYRHRCRRCIIEENSSRFRECRGDYHSQRKNTAETVLVIDIRITATITADITNRGISGRGTP